MVKLVYPVKDMLAYLYGTGMSAREIARRVGCAPSAIGRITKDPDRVLRTKTYDGLLRAFAQRKVEMAEVNGMIKESEHD